MAQRVTLSTSYKQCVFSFLIILGFYEVHLVPLSVFDSPAALKEIFITEVSLLENLKSSYSTTNEILDVLNYCYDRISTHRNKNVFHSFTKISAHKAMNVFHHPRCMSKVFLRDISLYLHKITNDEKHRYFRSQYKVEDKLPLRDSNAKVFNGAVLGILMLQDVYDLNVEHFANGSLQAAQEENQVIHDMDVQKPQQWLTTFDLVMLASHAIKIGWYDTAIKFLQLAILNNKKETSNHSNIFELEKLILYLHSIAKESLSVRQKHETFDLQSRLLPFSTARFDHSC